MDYISLKINQKKYISYIHCRNRNIIIFGVDQFMTFYKFSELISSEKFNRQFKPIQYVKEKILINGAFKLHRKPFPETSTKRKEHF